MKKSLKIVLNIIAVLVCFFILMILLYPATLMINAPEGAARTGCYNHIQALDIWISCGTIPLEIILIAFLAISVLTVWLINIIIKSKK